jgi:hypothetical protein
MIVGMFVASLDEKNVQWGKCCAMKTYVYLEGDIPTRSTRLNTLLNHDMGTSLRMTTRSKQARSNTSLLLRAII